MSIRINLLGGPGSGKSTTAAWLFSALKTLGKPIELVGEYVKSWTYINRSVQKWDQCYLWAKQQQYEYRFLNANKNVVTDSPTLLAPIYAKVYYPGSNIAERLAALNEEYEKDYPSVNIFLNRKDKPYDESGRWQTYEQAQEIDELIRIQVRSLPNTYFIDYDDRDLILITALRYLDDETSAL